MSLEITVRECLIQQKPCHGYQYFRPKQAFALALQIHAQKDAARPRQFPRQAVCVITRPALAMQGEQNHHLEELADGESHA